MKEFLTVTKDGEQIKISPLTLEAHLRLGWTLVEPKAVPAPKAEDAGKTPADKPGKKSKKAEA